MGLDRNGIRALAVAGVLAAVLLPAAPGDAGGRRCDGRAVTHSGTSGNDNIEGTRGNDVIWAGDGDDKISTLLGEDVICAGRGNDFVGAGLSDDTIWGGGGRDRIKAGRGDDTVYGEDGADRILAGDQSDVINGNAGPDYIDMGYGPTSREGDEGFGGLGRDTLKTFGGVEAGHPPIRLFGNKGDDTLLGDDPAHRLDGGPGTDTCSPKTTRRNCEREGD